MSIVGLRDKLDKVWSLVMDEEVGIIGIYGLGGVGKTMLLRLIHDKFDGASTTIIWVTVSSNFSVRSIQDDIWRRIGSLDHNWVKKSIPEKAKCIHDVLTGQTKFVLCLDDLSQVIDIESIGLPYYRRFYHIEGPSYSRTHKESKVIFTTRTKLICDGMLADKRFYMEFLTEEAARSLFQKKVGEVILATDPKICDIAEEITRICARLPILLCTVGSAMACKKTFEDWFLALQDLKVSESMEITKKVSFLLRFCYDSLPNNTVKSCFLYLSLFPEDSTVLKNDLIDFWISEDFFGHFGSSSGSAQNLGLDVIDTLIRSNLLEEEIDSVKMLDMIHEFARSLALQSEVMENTQLINAMSLNSARTRRAVMNAMRLNSTSRAAQDYNATNLNSTRRAVQLMNEMRLNSTSRAAQYYNATNSNCIGRALFMEFSIKNLFHVTPDLLTFFLQRNPFIMIRNRPRAELTVLDLSNSCIEEVPQGISELVSLQHLNLSRTWIEQLPVELKKLVKLKCLNIENNDLLRVIPRQVISSLSSLLVLRMFRCGFSVQNEEDNILSAMNMGINELQCLQNLKVLSITITCASALKNFFSTHLLPSCTQALSLELFWGSKSINISQIAGIQHLLSLEIHHAEHLRDLNVNFRMDTSFTSLREVNVGKCSNLQDLTWLILAPNLTTVKVSSCQEMEEIISMQRLATRASFQS